MSQVEKASKLLAYILRHKPEALGITLDKEGWASVEELEVKSLQHGQIHLTAELLERVVESDKKGRYEFNEFKDEIRAVQGHSTTQVDIQFTATSPPPTLLHGTATKNAESIGQYGLTPGDRQYVHLSEDLSTAVAVGKRHGDLLVMQIDCNAMLKDGYKFYKAQNNVWLIESVPSKYLNVVFLE